MQTIAQDYRTSRTGLQSSGLLALKIMQFLVARAVLHKNYRESISFFGTGTSDLKIGNFLIFLRLCGDFQQVQIIFILQEGVLADSF
jgi:hypothetical protein